MAEAGIVTQPLNDPKAGGPPRRNRRRSSRSKAIRLSYFDNPIPAEVQDEGELKKFFKKYEALVPWSGTSQQSSHSLALFLQQLANTGTQGACKEAIKKYAFGGKMKISANTDYIFDLGEDEVEVSPQQRRLFVEFLNEHFTFMDTGDNQINIRTFSKYLFDSYRETGDLYLEIRLVETLGIKRVYFVTKKPTNYAYVRTKRGQQKYIADSDVWTEKYVKDNPLTITPLFPMYSEESKVWRTIFHYKNGNSKWYGRPEGGSFLNQYHELQEIIFKIKMSNSNYTGQVIAEVEDDEPLPGGGGNPDQQAEAEGFEGMADRIEENFSAGADDPQTFMLISRPYGAKPIVLAQIRPNTNHAEYKVNTEINERKIIADNHWSRRLLGESAANGFSANVVREELKAKKGVLDHYRQIVGEVINKAIDEGLDFLGNTEFMPLRIDYSTPEIPEDEQQNNNDGSRNRQARQR